MKTVLLTALVLTASCAASRTTHDDAELGSLRAELAQARTAQEQLEKRVGQLQAEVAAANGDGESTRVTIDGLTALREFTVRGAEPVNLDDALGVDRGRIACHLTGSEGRARVQRFLDQADLVFFLATEGRPAIEARMETICAHGFADGSVRYVFLQLPEGARLEPGLTYRLRPRNDSERYRWAVNPEVALVR